MTRRATAIWFVVGCGLVAVVQTVGLAGRGWDVTALLQVGPESPARPVIERDLGPVSLSGGQGHDGKYSYLIARSPWFWRADADTRAALEDPGYRYGRPLYPILAGLGGTLPPRATIYGLIVVQLVAGGLFAVALAGIAADNRLPSWAVLVGLGTPAVYTAPVLLTSDLLAVALLFLGVRDWHRERVERAAILFALAILAKEYYALTPLVLAVYAGWRSRLMLGGSLLPFVAWKLGIVLTLGTGGGGENFRWPGEGIAATAASWPHPLAGGLAVLLVVASLAAVVRPSVPRWQCVVWGLLGLTASERVWADPADLIRVIAPAWGFAVWAWWPRR